MIQCENIDTMNGKLYEIDEINIVIYREFKGKWHIFETYIKSSVFNCKEFTDNDGFEKIVLFSKRISIGTLMNL